MGFIPRTFDNGKPQPTEYMPVTGNINIDLGTALIAAGGKLALASGTNKPAYISACERTTTTAGEIIPAVRANSDVVFETELSVANSTIAIGTRYTIHTDGNGITTTDTGGVAEVVSFDGTAVGDHVRVRF